MIKVKCHFCKSEFNTYPCRIKIGGGKYCTHKCSEKVRKGEIGYWTGKKRPGLLTSTSFKKGFIPWNKNKRWDRMRGSNNPRWVGGSVKHPDKRIRKSIEYKEWRRSVFKRDNFICQICGRRGGNLQADHIRSFAMYPSLRFDIENGRTLCVECHKQTPTYARNAKSVEVVMPL